MSRIEVREEKRDRHWVVRVDPFFDPANNRRGFREKVTVYSDQDYSIEDHEYHWKKAEISWYSLGGVNPDEAEAFAKAIEVCFKKAREMDIEHKFRSAEVKA